MTLNGCMASGSQALKLIPCSTKCNLPRNLKHDPSLVHRSTHAFAASPKLRSFALVYRENKVLPLIEGSSPYLSGAFSSFLGGDSGSIVYMIPPLPVHCKVRPRSSMVCKALQAFSGYPPMTHKPRWWWRTLACIPYILPLHELLLYAESVYKLHSVLDRFHSLTNPLIVTMELLPNWFFMVFMLAVYLGVVRRKEWPHFLRFHVVLASLLGSGYQVMATACTWAPNALFKGTLGMHFWIGIAFLQMYTVLECMRCALGGKYADVPFVSDAAYIHTDLRLFGP